ncbi:MAG: site-specific DNA-methyltransferase [Nevskiales bacterium]|nr:site-specific DNA-methyltransferase [Nevskiales bacterium]
MTETATRPKAPRTSTVGRGRPISEVKSNDLTEWSDELTSVSLGDSLDFYSKWAKPTAIVSDGAYGVLGFEGDTSDHTGMPEWYEPHIEAWSKFATPQTTLWFWNSEIGWASVHPVLEKHGWRYVNANIWNKGKGHIAGNVNTKKIRRFPVVSEVCVQYVFEARVDGLILKQWLLREWKRTGLPLRKANDACGVKDAAVRKYLDQGHLWYFPPPETFEKLQQYANLHGKADGSPYFCLNGNNPASAEEWAKLRSKFYCPHGYTNVWERAALRNKERIKTNGDSGRSVHLNQKPLDLMNLIIEASSDVGDTIWEPFGGLFSASVAARRANRRAFAAEIDPVYFHYGAERIILEASQHQLL